MAEARFSQDHFRCPVCLELLKDPVTIPCGHSNCMSCITDHWNQEDEKRVYSCPQCRQTFSPRPALSKNIMLAEEVEKLKNAHFQTDVPATGDVECDVCTERKHKAVKSCLVCRNSFCQNHLEQHENLFKEKGHNLMDATERLQEMICSKHKKPLDIYCRTDHQCICVLCIVDEHKKHRTVSNAAERTEKQILVTEMLEKYQQQIHEGEKTFQELEEALDNHKRSAQTAVEDSERIFTELIRSIERKCSEVTPMIRAREKTVVSRTEALLKRLKQDIDNLRREKTDLEQLAKTDDHTHFLQCFPSLPVTPGSPVVPSITDGSLDVVEKSVSQLRQKLEDFCKEEIEKLYARGKVLETFGTHEIQDCCSYKIYTGASQKLEYFFHFTLDPNTVHKHFRLSEGNRVVSYADKLQEYPDHPDRFSYWWQVLCSESVRERCYWEVEWSGTETMDVCIAGSYKSIVRKGRGNRCKFGSNDQSWCLICSPSSYTFCHNNKQTKLSAVSRSCKIGVYVDHNIGIMSFYSVSDTMDLIHRVQTTFTQPLYPGFWINLSVVDRVFGPDKRPTLKLCDK
ncbi:E3 ubiquitin/ISG15 ligase TRIM25-like [Garra rufa]|uniref:E3 ubiquitin/ISG15 ligase TRIM25-like n=1 Tax=Garra rufa TaxID=137080 RepID=UPI003CCEAA79